MELVNTAFVTVVGPQNQGFNIILVCWLELSPIEGLVEVFHLI